jgi:hypothetical protein
MRQAKLFILLHQQVKMASITKRESLWILTRLFRCHMHHIPAIADAQHGPEPERTCLEELESPKIDWLQETHNMSQVACTVPGP